MSGGFVRATKEKQCAHEVRGGGYIHKCRQIHATFFYCGLEPKPGEHFLVLRPTGPNSNESQERGFLNDNRPHAGQTFLIFTVLNVDMIL